MPRHHPSGCRPRHPQYAAANSAAICRGHEDGTLAKSGYRGTYDGAEFLQWIA
jgi:hypothetical protein